VIGIDSDGGKLVQLQNGISPFSPQEPKIAEKLSEAIAKDRIEFTRDFRLVADADMICVCVPVDWTAWRSDIKVLSGVFARLAQHLKPQMGQVISIESTVPVGTCRKMIQLIEMATELEEGQDFYLVHAPERVMPTRLWLNLKNLVRIIGGRPEGVRRAAEMYSFIGPHAAYAATLEEAEMAKLVENTHRAVNIALANEIAEDCEAAGVDFWKVRDLVEHPLLMPGVVGGYCLPKDPWLYRESTQSVGSTGIVNQALLVNDRQPHRIVDLLKKHVNRKLNEAAVSVLGVAYLPRSTDVRNSPGFALRNLLETVVYRVGVHDPYVYPEKDLLKMFRQADCAVIMTAHPEYVQLDPEDVRRSMRQKLIIDVRNCLFLRDWERAGFKVVRLGDGKA
jgi:UDP-N-acetyl-D-mannosaminuronic acid dehydrogenase